MQSSCRRTILGCYVGYIVQAIVNNFVPLLFVMFERTYQIPLSKITLLITINFCIQLGIDLLSARVSAVPGDRFLKVEFIPAEEGRK